MNNEKIKLFLVDDDVVFLKSLEIDFLQHADFTIETFVTGELCLANLSHDPDVIILDYYLNGIEKDAINGIDTLDRIKAYNQDIPVVILSSQDKIDVAINCKQVTLIYDYMDNHGISDDHWDSVKQIYYRNKKRYLTKNNVKV